MAIAFTLEIDDTSPTINYYPPLNNLSFPDSSTGWIPCYSYSGCQPTPGEVGAGISLYQTSLAGASLSLTWFGTGVELYGSATYTSWAASVDGSLNNSTATIALGNQSLLAAFSGLPNGQHTVTLTVGSNSSSYALIFEKALVISSVATTNGTIHSASVPDSSISFQGQWSYDCGLMLNSCFHRSNTTGDNARLNFTGTAVTVSGLRDITSGRYNVSLDGVVFNFNAQSVWKETTQLFFKTGLNPDINHELIITNAEDNLLAISAINVTSISGANVSKSNSSLSKGAIAGVVIGVVVGVLAIGALMFFLWGRRKQRTPSTLTFNEASIRKGHEGAQVVDTRHDVVYYDKLSHTRRLPLDHISLDFAPNPELDRFRERQKPAPMNLPRSPTVSSPSSRSHFLRDASLGSLWHHTEPTDPASYLSVNIRSPFQVDFEHVSLSPRRTIARPMGPREQPKQESKESKEPEEQLQPPPRINVTYELDRSNITSFLELDSSSSGVSSIRQVISDSQQLQSHLLMHSNSHSRSQSAHSLSNSTQTGQRYSDQSRSSAGPLSFAVVIQQSTARVERPAESHPYSDPRLDVPIEIEEISPTESVPMTVSEIHFREMTAEDGYKRRSGSQSPTHPPLNASPSSTGRRTFTSPTIVQKLFGTQQTQPSRERRASRPLSLTASTLLPRFSPKR